MEADLEHAVFNPAASYNTDTYVTKRHSLIRSLVTRVQFIAGQIDEGGWEGDRT